MSIQGKQKFKNFVSTFEESYCGKSSFSSDFRNTRLLLVSILLFFAPQYSWAGAYIFAGENNGIDLVTHPISYTGSPGQIELNVCVNGTAQEKADMEQSVRNIIAIFNGYFMTPPDLSRNTPILDIV